MQNKNNNIIANRKNNVSLPKVCFAASSGGHFEQLMMLKPLIEKYNGFIITEKTYYQTESDFKTYKLKQINRNQLSFLPNMLYNTFASLAIFIIERPDAIVSTGVLATIPICIISKLFGRRLVYIESFAKVTTATKTGALLYRIADRFYVQWEEMLDVFPNAIFVGSIY